MTVYNRWAIPLAIFFGLVVGVFIIIFVTSCIDTALHRTHSEEIYPHEYERVDLWAEKYPGVKKDIIDPSLNDLKINRKEFQEIRNAVESKQRQSILSRLLRWG